MPYTSTPVIILAVDTTSPGGSAAVLCDQRVIGSVSTWTVETYSSRMFRQVEFLLSELASGLDQIDLFAVASGPGSFTGLRVGIAAVKAWAEVYGKPVVGVSALDAIAEQSRATADILVPLLDARRGEVYFSFQRRKGDLANPQLELESEHSVMTPVNFLQEVRSRVGNSPCTIVTPTPEVLAQEMNLHPCGTANLKVETVPNILAPIVGSIAARRAARSERLENSLSLDANYVRRTDAELKWKAL